jgi:hypothetical protein
MVVKLVDRLVPWVVGALVVTVASGAVYGALQQGDRSSADDAPRALVSQLVADSRGDSPGALPSPRVDLASSLMPFYVIYDLDGRPIAGDGYLDGKRARIPDGVLRHTVGTGADHLTWEPEPGLRFALVTVRHNGTVVAAGQSLAPFEERTDRIGLLLVGGWLLTLFVLACGAVLHLVLGRRSDRGPVTDVH